MLHHFLSPSFQFPQTSSAASPPAICLADFGHRVGGLRVLFPGDFLSVLMGEAQSVDVGKRWVPSSQGLGRGVPSGRGSCPPCRELEAWPRLRSPAAPGS